MDTHEPAAGNDVEMTNNKHGDRLLIAGLFSGSKNGIAVRED